MGLPPWPAGAEEVAGGAGRPGGGQRDEAHQQVELARVGEAGVLEVEAAGLGVAEQTLDGPALAVGVAGGAGLGIGGEDQPLAPPITVPEGLGDEAQAVAPMVFAGAEPTGKHLGALAPVEAVVEGEFMTILGSDAQVTAQADGEGDVVFTQEIGPGMAPRLRGGRL